jgi:hypothetical protein
MLRILVLLVLLVFVSCTGGEPTGQQESAPGGQAAEDVGGGGPPDQQMVECLNRFREKKYDEAIRVCRAALASNPGDPQILKAIEMSEQALKEEGGA